MKPEVPPATEQKAPKAEEIRVVAAEIERQGRFLITQRRPTAILPLLWEFPSGKVEADETDEDALRREIELRLGVQIEVEHLSMTLRHEYEDYTIDLCVYRCTLLSDALERRRVHDFRWVTPAEMSDYEFPPADALTLKQLLNEEHKEP